MAVSAPSREKTASPPAPVKRGRPGLIARVMVVVAIVLIFQVVAVVATEVILYVAGIGEEHIVLWDEQLGFRHRSNKRVTWRREGYSQSYFGSDGLRQAGIAFQKKPGTYRIALMGDSVVEGLQEPLDETFAARLERQITAKLNRPVEVINFGVFAYSTVQESLYLKEVLKKYGPDLVVLCYNTRDMAETLESWAPAGTQARGQRPYAIKTDGQPLEVSNAPVVNAATDARARLWEQMNWLRQNSRIVGFLAENRPNVSLHNPLIEGIVAFVHNPSRGFASMFMPESKSPSFKIKFFDESTQTKKKRNTDQTAEQAHNNLQVETEPARRSAAVQVGAEPAQHHSLVSAAASSYSQTNNVSFVEGAQGAPQGSAAGAPQGSAAGAPQSGAAGAPQGSAAGAPQGSAAGAPQSSAAGAPQSGAAGAPQSSAAGAPQSGAAGAPQGSAAKDGQRQYYLRTLDNTFGALLGTMNEDCKKFGAKLTVAIMPWRSDLLPTNAGGMPPSPFGVTFDDEVAFVSQNCKEQDIPCYDCHQDASKQSAAEIKKMFFVFHLTRIGHKFIADRLLEFLADQIAVSTASSSAARHP